MLYTVSGPSSIGKSIVIKQFIERNGFYRVVPYTSRKIREHEGEIDGREYYFRSEDDIMKVSENLTIGYWDFVFGSVYGYSNDIISAIFEAKNYIVLATTKIALSIKKDFPSVMTCFLDFQTDEELEKRISERFYPNKDLIEEKMLNAKTEREFKNNFDIILNNNDPFLHYESLVKIIIK